MLESRKRLEYVGRKGGIGGGSGSGFSRSRRSREAPGQAGRSRLPAPGCGQRSPCRRGGSRYGRLSLVEIEGVDPKHCTAWQEIVDQLQEAIVVWRSTARRRLRNTGVHSPLADDLDDSDSGLDKDAEAVRLDEWESADSAGVMIAQ